MALSNKQIEILISARDKATKVLRGVKKAFKKLAKSAKNVGKGIGGVFKKLSGVLFNFKTSLIALAGAGGFGMLAKGIIDTGIEFENYKATLKTVLGSQEKANKSFEWLEKFASSTPFAINELTESFVKLAAYGIDGTKSLKTLGDAASAMGKPIMQAVEAMADAQTGEFERMKEFGIKAVQITKANASRMGASLEEVGKTALSFTDKMGKEQFKIIDRNNREMVTNTIQAIWNEKYQGAMEERSKTLGGILSNMGDRWVKFKSSVADNILPLLSKRLKQFGDVVDEYFLNSGGAAEGWEKLISNVMKNGVEYITGFGAGLVQLAYDSGIAFKGMENDSESWQKLGRKHVKFLKAKYKEFKEWMDTNGKSMWNEVKAGAQSIMTVFSAVARAINGVISAYRSLQRFGKNIGIGAAEMVGQGSTAQTLRAGGLSYSQGRYPINQDVVDRTTDTQEPVTVNNIYTSNNRQSVDRATESRGSMSPQYGSSGYSPGAMLPMGYGK